MCPEEGVCSPACARPRNDGHRCYLPRPPVGPVPADREQVLHEVPAGDMQSSQGQAPPPPTPPRAPGQVRATHQRLHNGQRAAWDSRPWGCKRHSSQPACGLGHNCRRVSCFSSHTRPHCVSLLSRPPCWRPCILPSPVPAPRQEERSFRLEFPLLCTWPHGDREDGSGAATAPDHGCQCRGPRCSHLRPPGWGTCRSPQRRLVPRAHLLCGCLAWGRVMGASPPQTSNPDPLPSGGAFPGESVLAVCSAGRNGSCLASTKLQHNGGAGGAAPLFFSRDLTETSQISVPHSPALVKCFLHSS